MSDMQPPSHTQRLRMERRLTLRGLVTLSECLHLRLHFGVLAMEPDGHCQNIVRQESEGETES
jgi:hypothetical protein